MIGAEKRLRCECEFPVKLISDALSFIMRLSIFVIGKVVFLDTNAPKKVYESLAQKVLFLSRNTGIRRLRSVPGYTVPTLFSCND